MNSQKIQLVFFTLLLGHHAFSQAPPIEWQNTIGGNDVDNLYCIQQTSDGGYILGGSSSSDISGDKTEAAFGLNSVDYWVVKVNATGTIEWQNTIGGNDWDDLSVITQTSDGGYFLAGISESGISGDKTEPSMGDFDYWVVKLNSTGVIEWQNTLGGSKDEYLRSAAQTSDGGYIVGGWSLSGITGDKTEASLGSFDYWIIKLSNTGTIEWQNTIGGNSFDAMWSLKQTTDGGYILGGVSESGISGDKTEPSLGLRDYWVIKLNSTGGIEWQNTIGGSNFDELYSIDQTTDGGFILGGYSSSGISGDKTEPGLGSTDFWVVKLNSSGAIQWQNTIGGSDQDEVNSIQQTADGGYILGGPSQSDISGDKTENSFGNDNYWVIKLNSVGTIIWQNTIGGYTTDYYLHGGDFLQTVLQTVDGGYVLGGYSDSFSGDKSETCLGGFDYWIVKLEADVCNTPLGEFSSNITATTAKTNWNQVSQANKYKVRYRPTGTNTWTTVSATNNFKKLKALSPLTQYDWQVKSICNVSGLGNSGWSSTKTFTTLSLKIGDELGIENLFTVYPNPASDFATIEFSLSNSSDVEISLLDLQGRKIKTISPDPSGGKFDPEESAGIHQFQFDCGDLPAGLYLLQLKTESGIETKKLIIE